MKPINIISTAKKYYNLRDFKKLINKSLNQLASIITQHFKGISHSLIKKTFWDLVDEKVSDDPNNIYIKIAYLEGRVISYDILYRKRKIRLEDRNLRNQWFTYILGRILKYELKIKDEFFAKLYSHFPVVDPKTMMSLYEEMIRLFERSELKEVLEDQNIDPISKMMEFKGFYSRYYETFLGRCEYFGIELGKHENNKIYGNDLRNIFQLRARNRSGKIQNNKDERTPPLLCDNNLDMLIHIRNAISHSGRCIEVNSEDSCVRIKDFKGSICTFDRVFTFPQLWNIIYKIIIMDREFETVTLFIAIFRQIRLANRVYNIKLKCFKCEYIGEYYVPPSKVYVTCKKCKQQLHTKGFK